LAPITLPPALLNRVPHRSLHNAMYSSICFVAINFSTTPTTPTLIREIGHFVSCSTVSGFIFEIVEMSDIEDESFITGTISRSNEDVVSVLFSSVQTFSLHTFVERVPVSGNDCSFCSFSSFSFFCLSLFSSFSRETEIDCDCNNGCCDGVVDGSWNDDNNIVNGVDGDDDDVVVAVAVTLVVVVVGGGGGGG
jgi:hypothetical protein